TTLPEWSKTMQRVLVVPWSIAAAYFAISSPLCSVLHRGRGGPQQQVRRGRARVLVAGAALAQVAGAALAGHQRDRRLHARLGGVGGGGERGGLVAAVGLLERLQRRQQRVHHRLVLALGLAARLDALDAGLERCGE